MSSGRQMAISFPSRKHGRQDRSLFLKRLFSLRDVGGNGERTELPKKRARIYDLIRGKEKGSQLLHSLGLYLPPRLSTDANLSAANIETNDKLGQTPNTEEAAERGSTQ